MRWSFSRLTTYERCSYCFYLTYIKKLYIIMHSNNTKDIPMHIYDTKKEAEEKLKHLLSKDNSYFIIEKSLEKSQNAFAEYGLLCHELLEKYFKNELMIFELLNEYNDKFTQNVIHDFPPNKYVDLACNYFKQGQDYFTNFDGLPQYKIIDAERKVEFNIDKYPFIGYIDLIAKDESGDIHIIDHKSKDLSKVQKKRWDNIEVRRTTELYEYLRQLYIYAIPIIEQENIRPKYLNFNCFRKPTKSGKVNWIQIPFDYDDYKESKKWAYNIIQDIYKDEKMDKTYKNDWFCNQLCSVKEYCPNSNRYLGI